MHKSNQIKRLLIANRGEIAVRIIRATRKLGIESVAVYSDPDRGSLHQRFADKALALCGSSAKDSYLNIEKLILAAKQSGADAIHPGYGFLAENAEFAREVAAAGLVFVGPTPDVMNLLGDKEQARNVATEAGVPVVRGTKAGLSLPEYLSLAAEIGYPVLVKAVAGGSGRGMRVVDAAGQLEQKIAEASAEALAGFGNGKVFLEKYIPQPRHIEIQVFSDSFGNHTHVLERECSLQRRHQKLLEEAPAPNLHPELAKKIRSAAVSLCQKVNYIGAGTAEFLVDGGDSPNDPFYFLEMNTRIQVEHPVTEVVTGIDLVQEQILVASGARLSFGSEEIIPTKHAIEFRIYAEDPRNEFKPRTGKVKYVHRALGPEVREDSWIESGTELSPYYDALLSKIIVSGKDRIDAINRARAVLDEYLIEGLETTLGFHRWLLRQEDFIKGSCDIKWIERNYRGEILPARNSGRLRIEDLD